MHSLAEYASILNAGLAMAILGVILRASEMMRQAEKTRSDVITERLDGAKDQQGWLKERHEKERGDLEAKNEALRVQLDEILSGSGVTLEALAAGRSFSEAAAQTREAVRELLRKLEEGRIASPIENAEINLELAKGYMAQGNWQSAAERLDNYVRAAPDSFEVQFLRGVAWANTRKENIKALRAYGEAVALIDKNTPQRQVARAFVYRGAMLKRLGRLKESRNDLTHALEILENNGTSYEADDARYNLAGVQAMLGDKKEMLLSLDKIRNKAKYRDAVLHHLDGYFGMYKEDPDLALWLG